MSLTRYATRRDASEPAILRAIWKAGARYILLDPFDVLVLYRGAITMLEVKTPKTKTTRRGRMTRNQELLVQEGWPVRFVETPEEALAAIGAIAA